MPHEVQLVAKPTSSITPFSFEWRGSMHCVIKTCQSEGKQWDFANIKWSLFLSSSPFLSYFPPFYHQLYLTHSRSDAWSLYFSFLFSRHFKLRDRSRVGGLFVAHNNPDAGTEKQSTLDLSHCGTPSKTFNLYVNLLKFSLTHWNISEGIWSINKNDTNLKEHSSFQNV